MDILSNIYGLLNIPSLLLMPFCPHNKVDEWPEFPQTGKTADEGRLW